ncbi:AAA family ATPase [Sphingomonas koreensis]
MSDVIVREWKPLQLIVDEIGPFRSGPMTFSFLGETPPADAAMAGPPGPSNIYMLLAPNGYGKTTVMEAIHGLFGLLAQPATGRFADPLVGGRAQIDVRAALEIDGVLKTVLLSIWTGAQEPLHFWSKSDLEDVAQADEWGSLNLAIGPQGVHAADNSNEIGERFLASVRSAAGTPPTALMGESQSLPSVLYFPADRLLVAPETERFVARPDDWGYAPAYRFAQDGPTWSSTIDNLLVWLEWLRDERLQPLLDRVNAHVFEDTDKTILPPRREELLSYVSTERGVHLLSGLSHGERALLQMYTRVFAYTTSHTLLLIDEIELHLHTRWVHRMFRLLKAMLGEHAGLTLIFTTHDRELIRAFDYATPEPGLTKGGFLIDELR